MMLQMSIPLIFRFLAPFVSFGVGLYVWQRRPLAGATPFALLMMAMAWWGMGDALQSVVGSDLTAQMRWYILGRIGANLTVPLLMTFVLSYIDYEKRSARGLLMAIWLPTLVIFLLTFTNTRHGLVFSGFGLNQSGEGTTLMYQRGVLLQGFIAYSYLLLISSLVLLLRWSFAEARRLSRSQVVVVCCCFLVPLVMHGAFSIGLTELDLTPFVFPITNVGLAWAVFRDRFVDLPPMARGRVIEIMRDGMIVLDVQNRIVDINPAGARMIGVSALEAVGKPAREVLRPWAYLLEKFRDTYEAREEVIIGEGAARQRYEISLSALSDPQEQLVGRVIMLRPMGTLSERLPGFERGGTARETGTPSETPGGAVRSSSSSGKAKRRIFLLSWLADYFFPVIKSDLEVPSNVNPDWFQVMERAFTQVLRFAALLSPIDTILSTPDIFQVPGKWLTFLAIEVSLSTVAIVRTIPFKTRAIGFLIVLFAFAVEEVVNFGYSPESLLFFIVFVVTAGVLIRGKSGWAALLISLATMSFLGWQIQVGAIVPVGLNEDPSAQFPLPMLLSFMISAVGLNIILITLWDNWHLSWEKEKQASVLLQQERDLLDQRISERTRELEIEASERKQTVAVLKEQSRRLAILNTITRLGLEITDYQEMLQAFSDRLGELFNADGAFITLWDEENQRTIPAAAYGEMRDTYRTIQAEPGAKTMTASVLRSGRVLVAEDVTDSEFVSPQIAAQFLTRSMLGIPMIAGNQKLGAVLVSFHEPRLFTAEDVNHAEQASAQIAMAVARMHLLDSLQDELLQRQGMETALRTSEERYRNIFESVEDVIYETDFWGKILGISPSVERQSGFRPDELIGRNVLDFYAVPEDYMALVSIMEAQGTVNDFELRMKKKNGDSMIVSVTAHVVFDRAGNPVKTEGILRNITTRKEIELKVEKLNVELEQRVAERTAELESANQLLTSLGATAIAVTKSLDLDVVLDEILHNARKIVPYRGANIMLVDGDLAYVSRRLGYEALGDVSQRLTEIRFPITWPTFRHMLTTGESLYISDTARQTDWQFTQSADWVRAYIGVPLKAGLETVGFLNVSSDQPDAFKPGDVQKLEALAAHVTNALQNARLLSQLETALRQEQRMRSQLVQADKLSALGRMVASIAHEINNPIQTVKNAFFLLEDEFEPDTPAYEYLQMARTEANRIAELVRQLRDVYRPRAKKTHEPLELHKLLSDVEAILAPQLKRSQVVWQAAEGEGVQMMGYADQLKQVFINLGLNAIEAMEENRGGMLQVHIHEVPGKVGVEFHNNGPVIPSEQLPLLFEPFFTTKSMGTGLGLAICYDIAQQHHGEIAVESTPETGTSFTVWLPTQTG